VIRPGDDPRIAYRMIAALPQLAQTSNQRATRSQR
jgi:hypothetical protein